MKRLLLLSLSVGVSFFAAELVLRLCGYKPGQIGYDDFNFKATDKPVLLKGYLADSNALTYADPVVANRIHEFITTHNQKGLMLDISYRVTWSHWWSDVAGEFSKLGLDYARVRGNDDRSVFTSFYQQTINKPRLNDFDSLVINYVSSPINADGFRSISFRKNSTRKRILLIGDSFTFGHTTSNKAHSFYDILLANGYEVYNTGLSGSDPPQYLQIARKYIPLLKPDIVIVDFYPGNDVQYYHQEFSPYQTYFYPSTAGYLQACPEGVEMHDFAEAYRLAYDETHIPAGASTINSVCSKTVITTLIWNVFKNRLGFEQETKLMKDFRKKANKATISYPDANDKIRQIQELCKESNSQFVLTIIPTLSESTNKLKYVKDYRGLFPAEKYFEPGNFTTEDYSHEGDGHFNERGHEKYAVFLKSIIDSLESVPTNSIAGNFANPGVQHSQDGCLHKMR